MSDESRRRRGYRSGSIGGFYFLGFIGALVYYLQQADGFWRGVLGVLEALVWPAFFVYHVLKFIGA